MSHHNADSCGTVNLTIDGIPVTVPQGTRILEAARKINIHIPTLCDHPDLCRRAVCRLCVVECDGRGKLVAACANDVWEGVQIVTNNNRLLGIRKMIIELLLANHPQECLSCIRSTNCTLQSLAADFGIREPVFRHDAADRRLPVIESSTLVRDMAKCVKCGRCVEACQGIQSIRNIGTSRRGDRYEISAPYDQAFAAGPCVFCGQCAAVCPVGAIYGHDQSGEAWAAIHNKERPGVARHDVARHCVAVQFSPELSAAFANALGLPQEMVSPGKIVTALKRLGFDMVFNAQTFMEMVIMEENRELQNRIAQKNPMITGCASGYIKFIEDSYPDLADHLTHCKNTHQMFAALMQTAYPPAVACSITDCIAHKFNYRPVDAGIALTVTETARMLSMGGIDFTGLPETPFDDFAGQPAQAPDSAGYKTLIAYGFAQARAIMESIRKGECSADIVKIMSCPPGSTTQKCPVCKACVDGISTIC